jgi:tRNA threonylcarbamoyl adenosine modification protein YeaZ
VLVLAFDTTSEHGGAAIYRDQECLACARNLGGANYSVTLFHMVEGLLAQLNLGLRDIELFAVATGPGSFTGIRVGLAAAQGWAQAFGRPVRGVSVLEAMVEEARPEAVWAAPVLDARRGEFFVSILRRHGESCPAGGSRPASHGAGAWGYTVAPGSLIGKGTERTPDLKLEEARASRPLPSSTQSAAEHGLVLAQNSLRQFFEEFAMGERASQAICCLVREHDRRAQELRSTFPGHVLWQSVQGWLVDAVARVAVFARGEGRLQSPAELSASYIRCSDAELHWKG